jgi:hypothetical protein
MHSPIRFALAAMLFLAVLGTLPAVAAADTFADASRPDNTGDCLTRATACKTISGVDGALAKASAGSTVHVEPGTYVENVVLPGGISLVADSGDPTIAPVAGIALQVTGGPAVTIRGLTFSSNVANQPELVLRDGAGSVIVRDNTFIDPRPTSSDNQVGIRTTSHGAPEITGNGFSSLVNAVQVLSPATGVPGTPLIAGNTIRGVHDNGIGISVASGGSVQSVSGPTTVILAANLIHFPGAGQSIGVQLIDGGAFGANPGALTAGLTMVGNRIFGGTDGVQVLGAQAPVTLFGDVIAHTGDPVTGGTAIQAAAVNGIGGDLAVTNADLVNNLNLAAELQDDHLTLDSSIVSEPIFTQGTAGCTILFSAGSSTSGGSCQTFQTKEAPSFVDAAADDFHLTSTGNAALIDQGNPAAPPAGATDFDGDPRAIDADGVCPLDPVRDIGADELNPGIPICAPSGVPPGGGGQASPGPTGLRAAALKRCKRKHGKARRKCTRKAKHQPLRWPQADGGRR